LGHIVVHNTVAQTQFFSILPFLQTNITSQMWPNGGRVEKTCRNKRVFSCQLIVKTCLHIWVKPGIPIPVDLLRVPNLTSETPTHTRPVGMGIPACTGRPADSYSKLQ